MEVDPCQFFFFLQKVRRARNVHNLRIDKSCVHASEKDVRLASCREAGTFVKGRRTNRRRRARDDSHYCKTVSTPQFEQKKMCEHAEDYFLSSSSTRTPERVPKKGAES
jgi:hypothetical protein